MPSMPSMVPSSWSGSFGTIASCLRGSEHARTVVRGGGADEARQITVRRVQKPQPGKCAPTMRWTTVRRGRSEPERHTDVVDVRRPRTSPCYLNGGDGGADVHVVRHRNGEQRRSGPEPAGIRTAL